MKYLIDNLPCENKDPQGYCELSNNVSDKCKDLKHQCNSFRVELDNSVKEMARIDGFNACLAELKEKLR